MKSLVTVFLFGFFGLIIAQEYNFKPNWKKGDAKEIKITEVVKSYENDKLASTEESKRSVFLKVLKNKKNDITVEFELENPVTTIAINNFDIKESDFSDAKTLKIIYLINRESVEKKIINLEEVKTFVKNSIEETSLIIKNKKPESETYLEKAFKSVIASFEDEKNIDNYVTSRIGFLFTPYNTDFKIGETITKSESQENPLDKTQKVTTKTMLTLTSVDEASKTCEIKQIVDINLDEMMAKVKEMMVKMVQSSGKEESVINQEVKQMEDFSISIENEQVITFDYQNTWATKIINNISLTSTNPINSTKTKREVVVTAIVE